MVILVDMDGVLADFEKGLLDTYRRLHPDKPFISLAERTTFYPRDQYPKELAPLLEEIYTAKGFYRNLPAIEGSLDALRELQTHEDIFICTSPLSEYRNCVGEKYEWIDERLGNDWIKRVILAKDKTLVRGRILIDDKPHITGVIEPTWEHIVFDQPYNKNSTRRRINWSNWKNVL